MNNAAAGWLERLNGRVTSWLARIAAFLLALVGFLLAAGVETWLPHAGSAMRPSRPLALGGAVAVLAVDERHRPGLSGLVAGGREQQDRRPVPVEATLAAGLGYVFFRDHLPGF